MFTKLRHFILLKLGIIELRHKLATAEKNLNDRFDFLGAYMNLIQAGDIQIDQDIAAKVSERLQQEFGLKNINMATHKNDVMFAMHVFGHRYDTEQAVYTHFKIGAETANNLHSICTKHNLEPKSILDFGSGYGRVSRFLPQKFKNALVTVSEVKEQSLDFQKRHFGFDGVFHGQNHESFQSHKADLIIAISVFTHLPEKSFVPWMDTLIETLNPGGALIFTFNNSADAKYTAVTAGQRFMYQQFSEDKKFAFLSDSITDTNDYGNAFVTHEFLEDNLKTQPVTFEFLNYTLNPVQEAILITRNH